MASAAAAAVCRRTATARLHGAEQQGRPQSHPRWWRGRFRCRRRPLPHGNGAAPWDGPAPLPPHPPPPAAARQRRGSVRRPGCSAAAMASAAAAAVCCRTATARLHGAERQGRPQSHPRWWRSWTAQRLALSSETHIHLCQ